MFHVRIYSKEGAFLLETWNRGEMSKQMEIDAALSRKDVGKVEWWGSGLDACAKVTFYPDAKRHT